ncbi:ABC transporter ATP-binding protein/permease, partial [Opitutales bacterium]|nr:ABC transporter ATP-binding protein/permease [Opitutales bacterium]
IRLDAVVPVITALYIAYDPIKKLGAINSKIKEALASLQRLNEILDSKETVAEKENTLPLRGVSQSLEFRNVSFTYDSLAADTKNSPALKNLDVSIKAGESIALVGPSGAGKSTLINMLCRFQDPTAGSIFLDGVDIKEFGLKDLREAIALVPQKPFLFDMTVKQNIEVGKSKYTNQSISDSAHASNAIDFIMQLPRQFDERLGERASRISGGQLQRLALARAFFRNSPILILDEATSALDSENEEKIQDAMKNLIVGKTTIMIAHRFSSIRLADRILVMEAGSIIADGSHDVVYEKCPTYRKLYDQQSAS